MALQAPDLPWPAAAGGPGPGGHYKLSDKPLAGLLIIVPLSVAAYYRAKLGGQFRPAI